MVRKEGSDEDEPIIPACYTHGQIITSLARPRAINPAITCQTVISYGTARSRKGRIYVAIISFLFLLMIVGALEMYINQMIHESIR